MSKISKILLVDDDRDLLQVLQIALDLQGFKVVCSLDGQEAFFKFRNESFDLIITDLKMPKMDGTEFINVVRKVKETPIIIMSACLETFKLKLHEMKDVTNLTMLHKPFKPDYLIERIKELKKVSVKDLMFESMLSFKAGEVVFKDDSIQSDLYIVKEGSFSVYKRINRGDEIAIAVLTPGEALDDMLLYCDNKQSTRVVADTDGVLIRFPMEKIFETMNAQPVWFKIVMKTLSTRLSNSTIALVEAKAEIAMRNKK